MYGSWVRAPPGSLNSQVAEWKTHEKAGEIQTAPAMDDQVSSEGSHTGSIPVLTTIHSGPSMNTAEE